MYLIIPMSGQGTRFQKKGYTTPKPLIQINDQTIIERLLNCFPEKWTALFVLAENHRNTGLEDLILKLRPLAQIKYIEQHKFGPSYAVAQVIDLVPENEPVLISYCDYGMVWDAKNFENYVQQTQCDACVVSYRGFHPHYLSPTTYAYSKLENNKVVEIKEKGSFTENRENEFASCGAYYFKSAQILKFATEKQIEQNLSLNGEYYTSLTVQSLIQNNKTAFVNIFEISHFFQWGTPEDLEYYIYWEKTFKAYNKFYNLTGFVKQLLMPMAGRGSRFSKMTTTPKPLIKIDQKPMYQWALTSLPRAQDKTIFVVHSDFKKEIESYESKSLINVKSEIVDINYVTKGQAVTVGLALANLSPEQDVIISACDHSVVLNLEVWNSFKKNKDYDAAIFVVKGFPGCARSPNSYAYVEVDSSDKSEFKKVKSVSVKKPVSDSPSKDFLLVGTFWFKNKSILNTGLTKLIESGKTVNDEFYLDSIFEHLLSSYKVVVIELDGYINWGDPQSLSEAMYWHECFAGFKLRQNIGDPS